MTTPDTYPPDSIFTGVQASTSPWFLVIIPSLWLKGVLTTGLTYMYIIGSGRCLIWVTVTHFVPVSTHSYVMCLPPKKDPVIHVTGFRQSPHHTPLVFTQSHNVQRLTENKKMVLVSSVHIISSTKLLRGEVTIKIAYLCVAQWAQPNHRILPLC